MRFALPENTNVVLEVYDINGRLISKLVDSNMDAGNYSVVWNADRFSSGVYFVKMIAGEYISTQKLMVLK